MRDRYFYMYEDIKYKECFYAAHGDRADRLNCAYSLFTLAISIISVFVWGISKSMPALWASIIALAQFAQVLNSKFPWASQMTALKFLMPELAKLSLDIDHDWLLSDVEGYDDAKILHLISTYESRFKALEDQFTEGVKFSKKKQSILDEAEKEQRAYFYSRYPYTKNTENTERRELTNAR